MKSVSISVITITRNNLVELKKTLESILEQDYPPAEIIIIDGASTDGTPEFLRSLNNKNIRWISEPDKGISDAYNKGVDLAGGDLFIFMNASDGFVNTRTLSQAVALIPDGVNLTESVVYGDYYQVVDSEWNLQRADHTKLHESCSLNHQSAFIGREVGRKYRYDQRLPLGGDYDMWLRLLSARVPFIKIDLPIAKFQMDGISSRLDLRVHNIMLRYLLVTLNTGRIMTVQDAVRLACHAVLRYLNMCLRKIVGRRVIRTLKRVFGKTETGEVKTNEH